MLRVKRLSIIWRWVSVRHTLLRSSSDSCCNMVLSINIARRWRFCPTNLSSNTFFTTRKFFQWTSKLLLEPNRSINRYSHNWKTKALHHEKGKQAHYSYNILHNWLTTIRLKNDLVSSSLQFNSFICSRFIVSAIVFLTLLPSGIVTFPTPTSTVGMKGVMAKQLSMLKK